MENAENIAFIRRFMEACVRADPEEFGSYFTEDATWWNMPWKPVTGRDAIRDTLRRGANSMVALPWEILHIVADDDIVMVERVDNFLVGETRVRVPCMGVFELRGGKIAAWRDYWDLEQFERQLPTAPDCVVIAPDCAEQRAQVDAAAAPTAATSLVRTCSQRESGGRE